MSNTNVGIGIGLQAQPRDYTSSILKEMDLHEARQARQQQARVAGQKKDERDFDTYLKQSMVTPGKFHRIFEPEVERMGNDFMKQAAQLRQDHPNNWQNYVIPLAYKLKTELQRVGNVSADFDRFENQNPNELTAPQRKVQESLRTARDYNDYMNQVSQIQDKLGSVQVGPDGLFHPAYQLKNVDIGTAVKNQMNTLLNSNASTITARGAQHLLGNKYTVWDENIIPNTKADADVWSKQLTGVLGQTPKITSREEGLANLWATNPDIRNMFKESNRAKYESDNSLKTPQDVDNAAFQDFKNAYGGYGGQKIGQKIVSMPTGGRGGATGGARVWTDKQDEPITVQVEGKDDEPKTIQSYGGISVPNQTMTISVPSYYDPQTGKWNDKGFSNAEVRFTTVKKYNTKDLAPGKPDRTILLAQAVKKKDPSDATDTGQPIWIPITPEIAKSMKLNSGDKSVWDKFYGGYGKMNEANKQEVKKPETKKVKDDPLGLF